MVKVKVFVISATLGVVIAQAVVLPVAARLALWAAQTALWAYVGADAERKGRGTLWDHGDRLPVGSVLAIWWDRTVHGDGWMPAPRQVRLPEVENLDPDNLPSYV